MKKYRLLFVGIIATLLTFSGCNQTSESVSNNSEHLSSNEVTSSLEESSISYIENPFEEVVMEGAKMELRQHVFRKGDFIRVFVYDCKPKDWVGIYAKGTEPGKKTSIVWEYVEQKEYIEFPVSKLSELGTYDVFLCANDGYIVLDKDEIRVNDDDTTDYCVRDASYNINNQNGVNQLSITITPSSLKELTYSLYWSYEGEKLEDYTPLKVFKSEGKETITIELNECIFMPENATGIDVYIDEGMSSSFFIEMDDTLKLPKSNYLYNFQVFSDIHIQDCFMNHYSHLNTALKEVLRFAGNSEAIFTVGDNTNRGQENDYILLNSIIDSVFKEDVVHPSIYFSLGNHEYMYTSSFDSAIEMFKKYTKVENTYYSVEIQGCKFIVLGSNVKTLEGSLDDKQINWLKEQLSQVDKEKPTFLFLHQPLYNTVSGSLPGQGWDGMRNVSNTIKDVLKDYPNAILFTGHTHWTLDSKQPALYGKGINASFVNAASVGYLWNDEDKEEPGSEGLFIEVYEDYILIKGREFVDEKWVSSVQFIFQITKNV